VRLFLARVVLSVWLLTPFGRGCGSFRSVWFGGELCVWGGSAPVSDIGLGGAWELLRWHSFDGGEGRDLFRFWR
jgi:hypothetical protein